VCSDVSWNNEFRSDRCVSRSKELLTGLGCKYIGTSGLHHLISLTRLARLCLDNCHQLVLQDLGILAKITSLRSLSLNSAFSRYASSTIILEAMPNQRATELAELLPLFTRLTCLSLNGWPLATRHVSGVIHRCAFESLALMTNLVYLSLMKIEEAPNLKAQYFWRLTKLTTLETLKLSYSQLPKGLFQFSWLTKLIGLKLLEVISCGISSKRQLELCQLSNTQLCVLTCTID